MEKVISFASNSMIKRAKNMVEMIKPVFSSSKLVDLKGVKNNLIIYEDNISLVFAVKNSRYLKDGRVIDESDAIKWLKSKFEDLVSSEFEFTFSVYPEGDLLVYSINMKSL